MLLKTIDEIKDVVSVVYTRNSKMIDEYIDSLYEDDRYTLIRVAHAIYDIFDEEIYQELAKSGIKGYEDIPRGDVDAIIAEELIVSINFDYGGFKSGF